MVTLKAVDRFVGLVVVGSVLVGSYGWWRATRRGLERTHAMGEMMRVAPGTDPIWYLFGTLVTASVVVGAYVVSRLHIAEALSTPESADKADRGRREESDPPSESDTPSSATGSDQSGRSAPSDESTDGRPSPLAFLPEDERRVVRPIVESPGLTQVELRGRSGFSKAKVSQTVSDLEDRGLIYREKQGRTYRVFPGELLRERRES